MNISMLETKNISNYLTRGVGVTGLGLIGYESHSLGKHEAQVHAKNVKAESLAENFLEDQKLENPSAVKNALKKHIFNFNLDENLSGFFNSLVGYAKGFSHMVVSNVVPLGLSLGTVLAPKGLISKTFGAGLLAYGSIFFLQEAFGIGKTHE